MQTLGQWLDRQYRHSAIAMQASISALAVVKARPGFGQTMIAAGVRSSPRLFLPPTTRIPTISFTGFAIPRW
jgi:hypothetical protein